MLWPSVGILTYRPKAMEFAFEARILELEKKQLNWQTLETNVRMG
jgi:hypothetical protein